MEAPRSFLGREAEPNRATFLAVFTAMAGAIMFGLDQGNFGNVQGFESFLVEWCVGRFDSGYAITCSTDADLGAARNHHWQVTFVLWGGSLITIGAAVGALALGPIVTERYGRRPCISLGAAWCFVGCLFASYLSFHSVAVFMLGRFVTGFGVGVCCFALPMYSSEVATPRIRGQMGSLFQLNVVVGGFLATVVTLFITSWQMGMMLPGYAGALVSAMVWTTPESPRFVMSKHGFDAGLRELSRVRAGDAMPEAESISRQIQSEQQSGRVTYRQLLEHGGLRRRVFIACFLQVAQQLTGVNAFLSYANTLFRNVGITNPFAFNVLWNFIMIGACVTGLLLIDSPRGGRRIQLLGATVVMGPSLLLAGIGLKLHWPGLVTIVTLCVYAFGFQVAWGIIPWVYPSEIFTMSEKDTANSVAVFWQYAFNAVINLGTPALMSWSSSGTLLTFGALNFTNLFFVLAFIKETKGKPLEDIPAMFERR